MSSTLPHLPMKCGVKGCSCSEEYVNPDNGHQVVYCETHQAGAHIKLDEIPRVWNIILPIRRETFINAVMMAPDELKKFKEWKRKEENKDKEPF